ncbi:MAG: class I SAM-dependent methyltransferase [Patescibacteria group bacterium]
MEKKIKNKFSGDKESFIKNWRTRKEKFYNQWLRGEPKNQVQLAFRNHWEVFQELLKNRLFNKGKRCLEVGCGRGSISAYFCDAGYDCTLLDISPEVIEVAKGIFKQNKLKAKFKVGDANNLPFKDNSFDVIVSIGLLEHFQNIETPIKEQIRALDKGGILIGYVVPKYKNNIQKDYVWINEILKGYTKEEESTSYKMGLFRSDFPSKVYRKIFKKYKLRNVSSSGIYVLPMVSHSIDFPFTLMPKESELAVVKYFKKIIEIRRKKIKKHPWLCKEGVGQAFLIWGFKQK